MKNCQRTAVPCNSPLPFLICSPSVNRNSWTVVAPFLSSTFPHTTSQFFIEISETLKITFVILLRATLTVWVLVSHHSCGYIIGISRVSGSVNDVSYKCALALPGTSNLFRFSFSEVNSIHPFAVYAASSNTRRADHLSGSWASGHGGTSDKVILATANKELIGWLSGSMAANSFSRLSAFSLKDCASFSSCAARSFACPACFSAFPARSTASPASFVTRAFSCLTINCASLLPLSSITSPITTIIQHIPPNISIQNSCAPHHFKKRFSLNLCSQILNKISRPSPATPIMTSQVPKLAIDSQELRDAASAAVIIHKSNARPTAPSTPILHRATYDC